MPRQAPTEPQVQFTIRLPVKHVEELRVRGAKSSTLTQQLSELRAAEMVDEERGCYRAVRFEAAHELSGAEVVERWRSALPDGPRAMLDVLLGLDVPEVERAELCTMAGFSPTSSTPVTHLKLLRDNELVDVRNGTVKLTLAR